MNYFGYQILSPTPDQLAYMAAHTAAYNVWAQTCGKYKDSALHTLKMYWLGRLKATIQPVLALPDKCRGQHIPDPVDKIAAEIGLSSSCRQKLRAAGTAGLCLKATRQKVRKLKQSGAITGVGGVYITHERNRRGDKMYHRVRLNICSGGRRFRRDLGSYRVR